MLQEEGLHRRQDSTGTSLVLENSVVHLRVKIDALCPRWMEAPLFASVKQHFNTLILLRRQITHLATRHSTLLVRVSFRS